jgi:hypothetical protein
MAAYNQCVNSYDVIEAVPVGFDLFRSYFWRTFTTRNNALLVGMFLCESLLHVSVFWKT